MNKVLAVIVTYNPDLSIIKVIINKIFLDCDIIIIDNSDDINIKENILKYFLDKNKIKIISNKINLGIASAQNLGIDCAVRDAYKYVFLLDQDSIPEENTLTKLIDKFEFILGLGINIGSISASMFTQYLDRVINVSNVKISENKKYCDIRDINSSGTLISISNINIIGRMNEGLFLDYVDFEWGWRSQNKYFKNFIVNNPRIAHSLGNITYSFLGVKISIGNPIRGYYQYRNFLLLLPVSYVPVLWKFITLIKLLIRPFIYIFYRDEFTLRMYYIARGICDGLRGINGPYTK